MRDIEAQAKALAPVIARLVAREVEAAQSVLLEVIDEKNKQIDALMSEVREAASREAVMRAVNDAVAKIPAPKDGKYVDLGDIKQMVTDAVDEAVRSIPTPKDGTSITVDDVRPLIEAEIDKAVKQITPPKDGVGMAGAMIDRDGNLVITMTNGEVKELGPVVGGPGVDGIGFDDLSVEHDGERTVSLVFTKGERVKRFDLSLPVVIDRGIYKSDMDVKAGDGVTWGGSYWIAQKDMPTGKPGDPGSEGWRLAVKRGRDGKDGRNGIDFTKPVKVEVKE